MSGKRIFISDIHLGDDARYRDDVPERRARFIPSEHRDRLLNFLDKQIIAEKDNVKDLVLLGDVFDTWVCPFETDRPTDRPLFSIVRKTNRSWIDCVKLPIRISIYAT